MNSRATLSVSPSMAFPVMLVTVVAATVVALLGADLGFPWIQDVSAQNVWWIVAGLQVAVAAVALPLFGGARPSEAPAVAFVGLPFEAAVMGAMGGAIEWGDLWRLRVVLLGLVFVAAEGQRAVAAGRMSPPGLAAMGGFLLWGWPLVSALLQDGGVAVPPWLEGNLFVMVHEGLALPLLLVPLWWLVLRSLAFGKGAS